jgi:hypothetical protein
MEAATKIDRAIKFLETQKNLCVAFFPGVAEPGYDDTPMFASNWNKVSRKLYDWLEEQAKEANCQIDWDDEWTSCGICGKAIRMVQDSYSWIGYYVRTDYELYCMDCIKGDATLQRDVLPEFINDPRMALHPDFPLSDHDFHPYCENGDEIEFDSGLHTHWDDDPKKVATRIREKYGEKVQIVFQLTDAEQFGIHWKAFIRSGDSHEIR